MRTYVVLYLKYIRIYTLSLRICVTAMQNKSPSPIRYSPRSYSPTRPSSLLKSSQSPTRSPTRSKHPVGTFSPPKSPSSHSTHSKSPTTKIPVSRSPPPEMNIAQKSRSPHTTSKRPYSKTPPPELSKGPVSEKLQFGSRAKTPPNVRLHTYSLNNNLMILFAMLTSHLLPFPERNMTKRWIG